MKWDLAKELKNAGFPQGGQGVYIVEPDTSEKVYVPTIDEIVTTYLGDPDRWDDMRNAMAKVWIENRKPKHE